MRMTTSKRAGPSASKTKTKRGPSFAIAALVTLLFAHTALAAGVEDTVGGAIALGRAANYARVNDFMATWQNPANLAVIPGTDVGLELRVPFFVACFDRARDPNKLYKVPDQSTGFQGEESFAQVCNKARPMPSGNLGIAKSYNSGWGWGLGFFTPAGTSSLKFGSDTVVTWPPYFSNEQAKITQNGSESANRYLLLDRKVMAGWLMAGLGVSPIKQLRLGVSAGWGFANVAYKNAASLTGQTFQDQEVLNDVHVQDWFVPRFTGSVVVTPVAFLDIMGQVTYTGDVEAKGHVDITANGIKGAKRGNCTADDPGPYCRINGAKLTAPYQPLEATLGVRYAYARHGKKRVLDPLADEVFDVEIDGYWAQTSHVKDFTLDLYSQTPGTPGAPHIDFTSDPAGSPAPLPPRAVLPHHWRDTYGVRLGGDYVVLPSILALRLGVSYESRAVPLQYMSIDYWPVQKLGIHAGLTGAIGPIKLSVGYAHFFNQTLTVLVGTGKVTEVTALDQQLAQAVNEGRYTSSIDVVSLQGNYRF
jgi:hypothetical protein